MDTVSSKSEQDVLRGVLHELVESRKTLHNVRLHLARGQPRRASEECGVAHVVTDALQSDNPLQLRAETRRRQLYNAACMAITHNSALKHMGSLVAHFIETFNVQKQVVGTISRGRQSPNVGDPGLDRKALSDYIINLNDAVELYIKSEIQKVRASLT